MFMQRLDLDEREKRIILNIPNNFKKKKKRKFNIYKIARRNNTNSKTLIVLVCNEHIDEIKRLVYKK